MGTILIIDDDSELGSMSKAMLEFDKHTVFLEVNPVKGIKTYRINYYKIDLVLLDVKMPQLSGKNVADTLYGINPNVKIVIISSYDEDQIKIKLGKTKIDGFIQKPYHKLTLLEQVRSALVN